MSNHLIVTTRVEEPQVFLVQKFSPEAIREAIRTDPFLHESRVTIFNFTPTHVGIENKFHGIPLTRVAQDVQPPFDHHLKTSLYYARIDGSRDEATQLRRAAKIILARLKELEARDVKPTGGVPENGGPSEVGPGEPSGETTAADDQGASSTT